MTHKQKTYLLVGAAIVAVVALMLVLTNGRADAGQPSTAKVTEICGPGAWKDKGGRWRHPREGGSVWCSTTTTTTTTTGLVPEVPGTATPGTGTIPPATLSPSTTICRIGENGLGTYPNGEPCGTQTLRPVVVIAQPRYTG